MNKILQKIISIIKQKNNKEFVYRKEGETKEQYAKRALKFVSKSYEQDNKSKSKIITKPLVGGLIVNNCKCTECKCDKN